MIGGLGFFFCAKEFGLGRAGVIVRTGSGSDTDQYTPTSLFNEKLCREEETGGDDDDEGDETKPSVDLPSTGDVARSALGVSGRFKNLSDIAKSVRYLPPLLCRRGIGFVS